MACGFGYSTGAGHVHGVATLELDLAEEIAGHPNKFPSVLVEIAEARCRATVSQKIIPVAQIADKDGWFAGYVWRDHLTVSRDIGSWAAVYR